MWNDHKDLLFLCSVSKDVVFYFSISMLLTSYINDVSVLGELLSLASPEADSFLFPESAFTLDEVFVVLLVGREFASELLRSMSSSPGKKHKSGILP